MIDKNDLSQRPARPRVSGRVRGWLAAAAVVGLTWFALPGISWIQRLALNVAMIATAYLLAVEESVEDR